MFPTFRTLLASALVLAACSATADEKRTPPYEGFLCCNLMNDGGWINDINYRGERKQLLPAGTPVKVTGYGRNRVQIEFEGGKAAIGNDYSRALAIDDFARRYVLDQDPRPKIAAYPGRVREAIAAMKLTKGMTREQALQAVGYPPAYYTPDLEAPLWSYWADSSSEFQIFWGKDGRVDQVFGKPEVRARVFAE